MSAFPDYLRSSDPQVLATNRANKWAHEEFVKMCAQFAQAVGNKEWYAARGFGTQFLTGVPTKPEGLGAWTKNAPHRPHRNNHPWHERMNEIRWKAGTLPGLPDYAQKDAPTDFQTVMMFPSVNAFEWDGYVYTSIQGATSISGELDTDLWEEILGSQYHAAIEATKDAAHE